LELVLLGGICCEIEYEYESDKVQWKKDNFSHNNFHHASIVNAI